MLGLHRPSQPAQLEYAAKLYCAAGYNYGPSDLSWHKGDPREPDFAAKSIKSPLHCFDGHQELL